MNSAPWPERGPIGELVRQMVRSARLARYRLLTRCSLEHGTNVTISPHAGIFAPSFVRLGDRVSIGRNFICEVNLQVGSDVLISSNVAIIGNDHKFDDPASTVYRQGRNPDATVNIGSDVLIGFGSIVLADVGDGCIVGAGSIVTRSLPPYTVCYGNPARAARPRYESDPGANTISFPKRTV